MTKISVSVTPKELRGYVAAANRWAKLTRYRKQGKGNLAAFVREVLFLCSEPVAAGMPIVDVNAVKQKLGQTGGGR